MTRKHLIWLVVIAACAGAGLWWFYGAPAQISAAAVQRGTAVEIVYATGSVEPVRWAKVTTVVRDRIVDLCACEGQNVVKGDVLARLDDREAQAQLKELQTREEFLQRELARVSELISRGVTTAQAFERASRDVNQMQALIALQQVKIADYVIRSPIDGVVLRRDGEIGEIADVGQVLFRVGVPRPLQVVAEVNEEDIPRVRIGQIALLRTDAFPGQRLESNVREMTPMGDPVTKTYRIRLGLPDDSPLKPGMSVEANIVSREMPNALLVPSDAIQDNAVFVIDGGRATRRPVAVGIRGTRQSEIVSGLREGERVVSPVRSDVKDGSRVRIAPSPAAP
ncbi:MAG: efflux RND transporter periplasmic adaptor subunit [Alphaproteobacteria bacterium]|nr:efflux RND transporter periplasmic adaptor subunit [Alphaproteobacteria bacterium]